MKNGFDGFPRATLKFLKELQANNNRDWFNENKPRYEKDVLTPSLQFVEAMQTPLKKISQHITAIPKRTGGSLMRIYRDTRFAKDKTPYKTNIGVQFRHEMGKDVHAPGFYFHIDPKEIFFGAGIWHPENSVLRQIRDQIVEQEQRWMRISHNRHLSTSFKFAGDSLKRPPRDYDPDHSMIDDLKRKDFILIAKIGKNEILAKALVDRIYELMKRSNSFMSFLCESLRLPM